MKALARWFRSLQAQLILWAILPATLVLIALAFTGVTTHEHAMQAFVAERNATVARLLAERIETGLVQGTISPDGGEILTLLAGALPEGEALSAELAVVDRDGRVLAHSDPRRVGLSALDDPGVAMAFQVGSGSFLAPVAAATGTAHHEVLVTVAPVRGADWLVLLSEPVGELLGPILRFSSLGPIIAGVAMVLSLLILTFGWRTIVAPLQQLAQAAAQVSWGEHAAMDRSISGVAEIQELRNALHAMVERIEGYEAGIRDYLEALTEGQESERARLAHELHDGPVQALIALGQQVELAEQCVARGETARALELLGALREADTHVARDLRRVIGALRPIYLDDLGFLPALEMLARSTTLGAAAQGSDLEVRFEHDVGGVRFDPAVELAVYRIAQEALHNAAQHAQAHEVVVQVRRAAGELVLTVSDDGVGFTPAGRFDSYTRAGHFGLVGINERARQLGGALTIRSAPGAGTTLTVTFPESVLGVS